MQRQSQTQVLELGERIEDRIALTTEELVNATKEIQNKSFTNKKILESYLEPLMNEGYVDKHESNINHRSNIYYPVVDDSKVEKPNSLFDMFLDQKSNNEQQISRIKVSDFTLNPTSEYIKSKVEQVLCCSSTPDLFCELFDDNKNKITIDELVSTYYQNPSTRFCFREDKYEESLNDDRGGDEQQKEQESSSVEQTEVFDIRSTQKNEENEQRISTYYSCYYCNDFQPTNEEAGYKNHVILKHMLSSSDVNHPCYPCKADCLLSLRL